MNHENLKLLAFLGPAAPTAVTHFTERGIPKLHDEGNESTLTAEQALEQIHHLAEAGQHRIVIGPLASDDIYHALKHEFHHDLTVVLITEQPIINKPSHIDVVLEHDNDTAAFGKRLNELAEDLKFN